MRRSAAVTLLFALPFHLAGCTSQKTLVRTPAEIPQSEEHIVSLTTVDGHEIRFRKPGATLRDGRVLGAGTSTRVVELPEGEIAKSQSSQADNGRQRVQHVTLKDGGEVDFVAPGGSRHDGVVSGQIYEIVDLPVDQVQRVYMEETSVSVVKTIGFVIAVVGGAIAVAGIIAAATKESCPFVYSWDGQRFVFDAEPYGGATTRGLERDDYSELEHLRAEDGRYRLLVTNEVNETQYTNLMELWVVDHAPGVRLAADEHGGIHSVSGKVPPVSAVDARGRDLVPWLAQTDRLIWEPPAAPDGSGELRQEIVMSFRRPAGALRGRLVAHVATGLWGSHMIRELLGLRGREIGAFYASIDGSPQARAALMAWNLREELYTLKLEVEEPTGWEVRGLLPGGGPFISEDRVVPLDVSRAAGDVVRVRIRPPLGFWALNSFGIDWSPDRSVQVRVLKPIEARDASGQDRLPELLEADERFYAMPYSGDRGRITFEAPPLGNGVERTVFLHTRGYYRLHLAEDGEPDRERLRQLLEVPGAAARFAAERYAAWRSDRLASN
jgi:hypothetical protein